MTHSRANSRCWDWSSPTGTCVALYHKSQIISLNFWIDSSHLITLTSSYVIFYPLARALTELRYQLKWDHWHTYEPKYPLPAKQGTRTALVWALISHPHPAGSRLLKVRVCSVWFQCFLNSQAKCREKTNLPSIVSFETDIPYWHYSSESTSIPSELEPGSSLASHLLSHFNLPHSLPIISFYISLSKPSQILSPPSPTKPREKKLTLLCTKIALRGVLRFRFLSLAYGPKPIANKHTSTSLTHSLSCSGFWATVIACKSTIENSSRVSGAAVSCSSFQVRRAPR